jgi:hypothetical protein
LSQGFDISFVAIAAFATYPALLILTRSGYEGGIWLFYMMAIVFGFSGMPSWLIDFQATSISPKVKVIFGLLALSADTHNQRTLLLVDGIKMAYDCTIRPGESSSMFPY